MEGRAKTVSSGADHESVQVCLEVCDRVVAALNQGHPVDVACAGAGIGRTTFYRWLERARLPDAPLSLQSFLNSVMAAKRAPKKPASPAFAKSAIGKRAAPSRSRKGQSSVKVAGKLGAATGQAQTLSFVCQAKDLVPPVDYVNYRYLPATFRSQLLMSIHSLARDFPLEKKISELADDERCVFQSLVDAIAHASCQLAEPITFSWYGNSVTVAFTDFEFTRPIIHRLAARYIRDRQRHTHPTSPHASSEPQTETTQDEAEEACDESDNDWVFFDQSMDENGQFDGADALAAGLDDSPVPCDAPASYDDMFADNFFEDCQIAPGFGEDLPIFIVENPRDYDRMADFSEQFA